MLGSAISIQCCARRNNLRRGRLFIDAGEMFDKAKDAVYIKNITAGWVAKERCVSSVEYGQNGKLNQRAYTMESELIASDRAVNKIKPEGLTPGQTYGYRIVS